MFAAERFVEYGVDREKVVVVPESVNTSFFDPVLYVPLEELEVYRGKTVFLSIFKWEKRKGWDVLLEGYYNAFTGDDDVVLVIQTHGYHAEMGNGPFEQKNKFEAGLNVSSKPDVLIMDRFLSEEELARLYKAADVFVIPSRGEGWGRPHVEAMSMELPLIATYWSGPTSYMTHENSYPLDIDGLEYVGEGAFKDHQWAKPSVTELTRLMRHVVEHPKERVKV